MSKKPDVVYGEACLSWIDKMPGFCAQNGSGDLISSTTTISRLEAHIIGEDYITLALHGTFFIQPSICGWKGHNINHRLIGLVLERYDDGGLKVALLGDENTGVVSGNHRDNWLMYHNSIEVWSSSQYEHVSDYDPATDECQQKAGYNGYPVLNPYNRVWNGVGMYTGLAFDELLDYYPDLNSDHSVWEQSLFTGPTQLSRDKNNTRIWGDGVINHPIIYFPEFAQSPLHYIAGDLYSAATNLAMRIRGACPNRIAGYNIHSYSDYVGVNYNTWNTCALPFNVILTENEQEALNYLDTGRLPNDAFLYPLDWTELPTYHDDDSPDDNPNKNNPDDNTRDVTPNLPVVPSFTPSMLSNYNWYWLNVGDYSSFIQWFWNDIGAYNDFDDLINKVKGLYNDVASAVLMCRFYPVEISWIGGTGPQSNIKVGMIEKAGPVDTIGQSSPPAVREIGNIHIPNKYESFLDLSPYSQLSIYLPFHGFVDLDIDILSGHDLYVKGIYDYLTGTLQYLLYYDNQFLIDSFLVKMAVDIPITLQTKNDRDSAVFNNVASTVGGLLGAVGGLASGNPIGMALGVTQGVQAINGATASAPLNVKGTVGESGALYAPPKCAIILRRPTIQSSDKGSSLQTWSNNIGQLCGYGYTLNNLTNTGFTVVHSPRINFNKTTPMQQEIDEIYNYLQEGVIL